MLLLLNIGRSWLSLLTCVWRGCLMIHTRGKKTGFKQEGEQRREGMESKKFVSTKANSFHCNCPMIPHVRLLDGRSVCLSVGRSVCQNLLKGWEVTLPCSWVLPSLSYIHSPSHPRCVTHLQLQALSRILFGIWNVIFPSINRQYLRNFSVYKYIDSILYLQCMYISYTFTGTK